MMHRNFISKGKTTEKWGFFWKIVEERKVVL